MLEQGEFVDVVVFQARVTFVESALFVYKHPILVPAHKGLPGIFGKAKV